VVDRAEALLQQLNADAPLARALRTMIKAVTLDWGARFGDQTQPTGGAEAGFAAADSQTASPLTASELLAHSYAHQATNNLKAALVSARTAVEKSPEFAFGWARVAELEFSHGHTRMAKRAVERAIALSPRNAQAHALNGFLLAADHQLRPAIAAFDLAIEIDPALGNAWLGRGLCKRRLSLEVFSLGGSDEWQQDLQAAAILEPGRSLTRSYVGKAFAEVGDSRLAHKELNHAKTLDPNDPTPWLYSALLNREENRINTAVDDLEESVKRNDNRAVYRSRFLLDEDRAARSANLADVYQSAGMPEVARARSGPVRFL
jgi:tetratricopeptide (TPR) repeat protein